jgi:hypothetical protein
MLHDRSGRWRPITSEPMMGIDLGVDQHQYDEASDAERLK